MGDIFPKEYLREMNYKASLIDRVESLRKSDNLKYSKLIEKHRVEYRRLYILPIEKLKALVEDV